MLRKKVNSKRKKENSMQVLFVLNFLFPMWLLLLAFFPFLVGLFINYELIDTRQLVILLVWLPVFTIPFLVSGKRFFYYLVSVLCFINGFVDLVH